MDVCKAEYKDESNRSGRGRWCGIGVDFGWGARPDGKKKKRTKEKKGPCGGHPWGRRRKRGGGERGEGEREVTGSERRWRGGVGVYRKMSNDTQALVKLVWREPRSWHSLRWL